MKNVINFIFSFICYLLLIPCLLLLCTSAIWYILPASQLTGLGLKLAQVLDKESILLFTMLSIICTFFFWFMGKLFTVIKTSKALNFYTHLISWLMALVLCGLAVYVFFASKTLQSAPVRLDLTRKLGILSCVIAMLFYIIIAPKVRRLVDRRIQAYDTAKELNADSRSSVVGMQILKCFDFVCP